MNLEVIPTEDTQRIYGRKWIRKIRTQKLWHKLRLFSLAIGKFILILKHVKSSKQKSKNFPTFCLRLFNSKCLIEPNSVFFIFWALIILILMLWTIIVLPYYICFFDSRAESFENVQIFIDTTFILDIFVNFNTAYIDETDKVITDRKKIVQKYIKSWFFIDLISSIPFGVINFLFEGDNSGYIKLFRLIRLPRVYDLLRITRIFKVCKAFKQNSMIGKLMKTMKITEGLLRLIKFLFLIVCVVHITSCFWFVIGKEVDHESWVKRYEVDDMDHPEEYLMAFYYVFTTLTTVGYGDITPRTPPEQFFALLLIFFGVGLYSYIIGNLTTFFDRLDIRKTALKAKTTVVSDILNRLKIPMQVQEEIFLSLTRSFSKQEINWFDAQVLVSELPSALKSEVYYFLYSKTVKNIHFFEKKSLGVLMTVVPKLTYLRKEKSNYLYLEDSPSDESKDETVYFIEKGTVNFITSNGQKFRRMLEGSYFGELELMMNKSRLFSVEVGSSHIDLLVLSKSDFFLVIERCPDLLKELIKTAEKRILIFAKDMRKAEERSPNSSRLNLISVSSSESSEVNSDSEYINFQKLDTNLMVSNQNMSNEKLKNIRTWSKAMENENHFLDIPIRFSSKKKSPEDNFIRARKSIIKTLVEEPRKYIMIEQKKSSTVFFPAKENLEEREKLLEKFPSEFEFSDDTHSRFEEKSEVETWFEDGGRHLHRHRNTDSKWTHNFFTLLDKQYLVLENIRRIHVLLERAKSSGDLRFFEKTD